VIERIAKAGGMSAWMSKKNHSVAYCSKIPIEHYEWHYPRGSRHPYLELVPANSETRIFGVHLRAMFSNWGERRRKLELQSLLTSIRKHQEGFHLLMGDFNSLAPDEMLDINKMPAWIKAMTWLSGRDIQRDVVRTMLDNGYLDAFRSLHPENPGFTFPTYDPHLRFDYVFLPASTMSRLKQSSVIDMEEAKVASDHFPLLC
jgi:exodeoxyribonuclease-3